MATESDESVKKLSDDFVYALDDVERREAEEGEIYDVQAAYSHAFGLDCQKRNNIHLLDEENQVILTTVGSVAQIFNLKKDTINYVFCLDKDGIGASCVHPDKTYFVLAGKRDPNPNIYIYKYPSLELVRILRLGTERSYSSLSFSPDGEKLASVGGFPDFLLTVWDWKNEQIILRNKAFAQEVYNVSFSPTIPGSLTTSGLGHIRFWKMASTFTGIKLQGDIGKFGKVELSDVSAYAIMPDGKVLSGSESGSLLLWDGNFIKLEIRRPGGLLPHDGEVQVCHLIEEDAQMHDSQFLTAGDDSWIRWWTASTIDAAETTDEDPFLTLAPTREFKLENVKARCISLGEKIMALQDINGSIWIINLLDLEAKSVYRCHSGAILGLDTCPTQNFSATSGMDGTVRLYDHVDNRLIFDRKFNSAARTLLWAPTTVDRSARTVVVGFDDGVVRSLLKTKNEWKLLACFKPHNKPISDMKFSPNGQQFATISEEGTVFLFEIGRRVDGFIDYVPLGFVSLPESSNPSCIDWNSNSSAVIIGCASAMVVEVKIPQSLDEYSSKTSYELQLPIKTYHVTLPKPQAKTPEPPQDETSEEKKEDTNSKEAKTEQKKEDGEEGEEKVEEEEEVILGDVVQVLFRQSKNKAKTFYVSLDDSNANSIYECSFDEKHPVSVLDSGSNGSVKTSFDYSWSKNFFLTGEKSGGVIIRSLENMECYGKLQVHDGVYGHVNRTLTSFDDNFIISAGSDGGLNILKFNPSKFLEASAELATTLGDTMEAYNKRKKMGDKKQLKGHLEPVDASTNTKYNFAPCISSTIDDIHDETYEMSIEEVKDILDPDTYSIQDDKLKTEADNKKRLAEIKKDRVRQVIKDLRDDFSALLSENKEDIEPQQLSQEEFMIDPELEETIEKESQAKIDEVYLELQFDTEKSKKRLKKLKHAYLDNVLVENIELKAFERNYSVSSFRVTKFDSGLEEALGKIHALLEEGGEVTEKTSLENGDDGNANSDSSNAGAANGSDTSSGAAQAGNKKKAGKGWEARKAGRKDRKLKLADLLSKKPDENADDPADVAAISWVIKYMGDYKLKTSKDYQVPEDQQVNAEKKRRESILLEEAIMSIKTNFNQAFLGLRELKRRIVEKLRANVERIKEIDEDLKISKPTGVDKLKLEIDKNEWPEERLVYTERELDDYLLKIGIKPDSLLLSLSLTEDSHDKSESGESINEVIDEAKEIANLPIMKYTSSDNPSTKEQLTEKEKKINSVLLNFEREELVKRNRSTIEAFDSAVYDLRRERGKLSTDLKAVQLRQITLYYELMLLKEFEKTDIALATKMENCLTTKAQVMADITSCQENLSSKQAEIEVWQEKNRKIIDEFNVIVEGESNPFHEQLFKIFKKKIKRAKKSNNDDDDMSSDEEESDEDYDDEDEEDFDEEPVEDICPEGCEQAMYEKVLELREKRLDQEEILTEFTKAIDEIRKANDRFRGKEKQVNKDLTNTEIEIQQFQNEKQQKLNELDVFLVLKISQIVNITKEEDEEAEEEKDPSGDSNDRPEVDGDVQDSEPKLSSVIENCLVFSRDKLTTLHNRIGELNIENKEKKQEYKELHLSQKKLFRERKQKETTIAALQARCDDLQMLKFGQIIDLDLIEKMGESKQITDLQDKIKVRENEQRKTYAKLKKMIQAQKEALLRETQRNTVKLETIGNLTEAQQNLESNLNKSMNSISSSGVSMSSYQQMQEQNRLTQLIKLQTREIESLKSEIQLLRRGNPRTNQNQVI